MPKETIYDQAGMFDVTVGWAMDMDMQIGIVTHDGASLASHLIETDGDSADRHGTGDSYAQFTGVWASLDRYGINRLIKMLRKARDDAYGRDE